MKNWLAHINFIKSKQENYLNMKAETTLFLIISQLHSFQIEYSETGFPRLVERIIMLFSYYYLIILLLILLSSNIKIISCFATFYTPFSSLIFILICLPVSLLILRPCFHFTFYITSTLQSDHIATAVTFHFLGSATIFASRTGLHFQEALLIWIYQCLTDLIAH